MDPTGHNMIMPFKELEKPHNLCDTKSWNQFAQIMLKPAHNEKKKKETKEQKKGTKEQKKGTKEQKKETKEQKKENLKSCLSFFALISYWKCHLNCGSHDVDTHDPLLIMSPKAKIINQSKGIHLHSEDTRYLQDHLNELIKTNKRDPLNELIL